MMLIPCPICGPRAAMEFSFERPLETVALLSNAPDVLVDRLYTRTNSKGNCLELWRHAHGCRAFLILNRNTASHEILETRLFAGGP